MTKNAFINKVKRKLDRNGALPLNISNDTIEDIIEDSKKWFYDNYNESCNKFITLLPYALFTTEHFKKNRWIEFEDCVYSIYEFIENNMSRSFFYKDSINVLRHSIVNTVYYNGNYDIATFVAYMGLESVLENLNDNYIAFDWDFNKKRLYVIGHTPKTDVLIRGYTKVEDTTLFEDDFFRRYVEGQSYLAMGEILSFYDMPLPGGSSINPDVFTSKGEQMIEEVKEEVNEMVKPLWFIKF